MISKTVTLPKTPSAHAVEDRLLVWKRTVDIFASLAALPLLALLMVVMFWLTKRYSPGPILYRQERIGYKGRRFMCLKFRTMQSNADGKLHEQHYRDLVLRKQPMAKLDTKNDQRLIRGSWFLRESGLDELPQMLNTLRGDMSLVGPRPCLPYEYDMFEPWQRERFNTLPGLTGLWQVSGKNRTTFDEMCLLDVKYARERSLGMDLMIIMRTFPTLAAQVRDYFNRNRNQAAEPATRPLENVST